VCVRQQFDAHSCQWNPNGHHYYTPYFLQVNDVCSKACCVQSVKENMCDITVLKNFFTRLHFWKTYFHDGESTCHTKAPFLRLNWRFLEIAVHVLDWKLRYNKLRTRIAWNHKTPTAEFFTLPLGEFITLLAIEGFSWFVVFLNMRKRLYSEATVLNPEIKICSIDSKLSFYLVIEFEIHYCPVWQKLIFVLLVCSLPAHNLRSEMT
jgi:hypothetical protein